MYDAFISYSRQDQPAVEALKRQMKVRRLRVFLDTSSLRAGEEWPAQLGDAIKDSRLLLLCWSKDAQASKWVHAEIKFAQCAKKPFLPWLLDDTPPPAPLQQIHGIKTPDPVPIAAEIANRRRRDRTVLAAKAAALVVILAPTIWFSALHITPQSTAFHGSIVDNQNNPLSGAIVEADGRQTATNALGEFNLTLPVPPDIRRAITVHISKPDYRPRTIQTQTDVPLSVVLERGK